MAFSITKEEILHKGYIPFNYNSTKIKDQNLVVADHGQWVMLTDDEFDLLENGILETNSPLYQLLEAKGIILTLKNAEDIEDYYRKRMNFLFMGPSLHIVVLTKRCAHKCVYCHASAKNSNLNEYDMSIETARKTVDFIFQSPSNAMTIEFQGGEPLLNFDVLSFIVNYAKEKNKTAKKDLKIAVVTNLQEMDDRKLDFLMANDIYICTSLDGPEVLHNKNRICENKNFNSYANVNEWIKKIQKCCSEGKKRWNISALITATRDSLSMPKEIIDEYVNQNFKIISVRPVNKLGFSNKNFDKLGYSAEEFVDFWKKCVDYIIELNQKGVLIEERYFSLILTKILGKMDAGYVDLRSPCGACLGQLAYNYDGSVYSCDEARTLKEDIFKIGDVNMNYKDILGCDKSCSIISSSILENSSCEECVWKPFCGTCPVSTFSDTNSLIPVWGDDFRCKINNAQFYYVFKKIQDSSLRELVIKKWFSLGSG